MSCRGYVYPVIKLIRKVLCLFTFMSTCFEHAYYSSLGGIYSNWYVMLSSRGQLKCDGTRTETRFRLSAKRTSPFKSAVASVQSTAGSRGVRISGSNAGYTTFRGSVKGTGYPLHSPVSPSLSLPCVTVYHHISTGVYLLMMSSKPVRIM